MAAIETPLKERITSERLLDLRSVLDDLVRAKHRFAARSRGHPDRAALSKTTAHASARDHRRAGPRRPGAPGPQTRSRPADALVMRGVRPPVLPHRSAQGERQQDDRSDVVCVRAAPQHPRGGSARRRHRHREHPTVHVGLGRDAEADVARPAHRTRRHESAGPHALHARVLHDGAFGRESVRCRSRSLQHRQLRAAARTRADEVARCERLTHRQHRRLAAAVRVRSTRERHPHRTAPR